MENEIYGAKALVLLKYDGDISSLAAQLGAGLIIPDFDVETSEYPPHELIGSCELFGLEAWLESSSDVSGFPFQFSMNTEHCDEEIMGGRMHDLSLWLARYISEICKIETFVPTADGKKKLG